MILGLDFGTTNTGAATFDGQTLSALPLDPTHSNAAICRTAMYFTRDGHYYFGREAITRYFQQNLGRRTQLNRVWVGEIMQVFAELPTFYRDVYVYEDIYSPGRIFLSIKTSLRNRGYLGTTFQDQWYSPSDLVSTFLMAIQSRVRTALERPAREVVLGRPVHFSDNPTEDATAQQRLLQAAFKAGFEKVYLEYEPVAAARFYEQRLDRKKETVLVFDFGGGTLDFTVMEIGVPAERRILATGGIPIAGDVFDQRLFRDAIPRHLGEGSPLTSGRDIPPYIFESLADWQEILGLNTLDNLKVLDAIKQEAVEKDKVEALIEVVTSNYALMLFEQVEKAKVRLSSRPETVLSAKTDKLALEELITRGRFERVIEQEYQAIRQRLQETIARSGLAPRQIDRVLRTGGSSQIPRFVRLLEDLFGPDKVMAINTFGSVTAGLAVIGHEIEAGEAEYQVYTPDMAPETENVTEVKTHRGVKQRVDLGNVRHQIEVTHQVMTETAELPYHVVLSLDVEGQLAMVGADEIVFGTAVPDERRVWVQDDGPGLRAALLATTSDSEKILFATNQYRLALAPARSVLIATRFGAKGVRDLLRLDSGERVTAMLPWNPDRAEKRYVCMVTRTGQIRRLEAGLLAIQFRQAPYFKLENKYSSAPACLAQGDAGDQLVLGTSAGRVTRLPLSDLGITIYRGWKTQANEDVTAAVLAPPDAELMAVDQEARQFYFRCDMLPVTSAEGKKSQTLKRGTGIVGFASEHDLLDRRVYAFTGNGVLHALTPPPLRKPPKLGSTPHGTLALDGDWIVAVLGCDAP